MARLKELYVKEAAPALMKKFASFRGRPDGVAASHDIAQVHAHKPQVPAPRHGAAAARRRAFDFKLLDDGRRDGSLVRPDRSRHRSCFSSRPRPRT